MTRSVGVDLGELIQSVFDAPEPQDETSSRILDAAGELFVLRGIRRASVEEIAERSGVGRTTVYRHFDGRDQIVEAVLLRESRRFFGEILAASAATPSAFEDLVVEAFVTGLHTAQSSQFASLVRTEPELLSLLTVDGAPVIAAATEVLVTAFGPVRTEQDRTVVAATAELLVRLAISLVVSGPGAIPTDDSSAARHRLHALLDPILVPLTRLRG